LIVNKMYAMDGPDVKPPKPRSIVFDLFGDYLRYRGESVRLRVLARLLEDFSVPADTTRVALQRLRGDGWFESERDGRETLYRPTERTLEVLDEGRERIFDRTADAWDGEWHTAVLSVPESARAARDRLRRRLTWLGFGSLSAGVWVCAHDRFAEVRAAVAEEDGKARVDLLFSRTEGIEADREIARRCWDLEAIDRDYAEFATLLEKAIEGGRYADLAGAPALVERVNLVHAYRRFPFRDPDLPSALLPDGWHGADAHRLFLEAHELLRPAAEARVAELSAL